eukprot:Seg539.7 transcript_id=Seg539.7/GoldUCD/mRNA.D3Y31 product="hypothetical protein" protein_id=Seg539.7/GoldUCD/D3Y31
MQLKVLPLFSLKSGKLKYKLAASKFSTDKDGITLATTKDSVSPRSDFQAQGKDNYMKNVQSTQNETHDRGQIISDSFDGAKREKIEESESKLADKIPQKTSPSQNKPNANTQPISAVSPKQQGPSKPIGAGGAPTAIQKIFETTDQEISGQSPECQLVHEEGTSRIYFRIPEVTKGSKFQDKETTYSVLQCADISAGDLRVTTRFGSWDSMVARILIECDGPMFLWKRKDELIIDSNGHEIKDISYEYVILNSCMVKATFSVEKIAMVCKMMHLVKVAKTKEIANVRELKKHGVISKHTKPPSKIREGLPEWVNYIPYRWYSAKMRRIIEYLLITYTLLSLLWAVWQLYRHVDFIRSYLKPIVKFIEHYFSIFKAWFQWLDDLFSSLNHYWWHYFKPFFMLVVAAFSPLFQIFRPLKGIVNILPHIFDPFIQFFNMLYLFVKPIFMPFKMLFGLVTQNATNFVSNVVVSLMRNPTIAHVISRGSDFYIVKLIQEALHGHLDPLKAQVIVIKDLIFKSSRKIYYGLRFIVSKTYFMILILRREREYSKEGSTMGQPQLQQEGSTMGQPQLQQEIPVTGQEQNGEQTKYKSD